MNEFDPVDGRLVRILGATRAPANPAVLARARARLAESARVPGRLAWLGTPAALAAACALFVAVVCTSIAIVGTEATPARDTTLVSALIGDDGSYGLPTASGTASGTASTATEYSDTGTVTP
jgi:hypothetical protein